MKTRFYIVRHGETKWNSQDIIQGQQDSPLTEFGKKQAKERAKDFAHIKFSAAFSSDLDRAHETAKILAGKKISVQTDERLRERRYAALDGMEISVARTKYADRFALRETLSREERITFRLADGVENDEEMMKRLTAFLLEKSQEHKGKTILAVAHGDLLRSFLMWIGKYKYGELRGGSVSNLGYVILECDGENIEVVKTVGVKKR